MPNVITITGPSRAGKSTTVGYLLRCADETFRPTLVPKYTTRAPRDVDSDNEVICIPRDIDGGREVNCVSRIPDECDLVYEQYGDRYGLKMQTIFELIEKGQSPVVILNDVRAVEDVRASLRELVRSVFVFREDPATQEYRQKLIDYRGREAAEPRFRKAQTIFRIYIENIHLFDHLVINSGTCEQLEIQVKQIVKGLIDPNWPLHSRA